MFDFSKDYYHNTEMLDRYIKLLDFYQRAQDNKGGWCYFTAGEDKGKWLGVSLDGTGERLTGEWWPLFISWRGRDDAVVYTTQQLHRKRR